MLVGCVESQQPSCLAEKTEFPRRFDWESSRGMFLPVIVLGSKQMNKRAYSMEIRTGARKPSKTT